MKTNDLVGLLNRFISERVLTNFPRIEEVIFIEEGHIGIIPERKMVFSNNPSVKRKCNKESENLFCRQFLNHRGYKHGEFESGKYFEKNTIEMLLFFQQWSISFIVPAKYERTINEHSLVSAILEATFTFYGNEYGVDEKVVEVIESGRKIKYSYEFFICHVKPEMNEKANSKRIKRQINENVNNNRYLCHSNRIQEIDTLIKSLSKLKSL